MKISKKRLKIVASVTFFEISMFFLFKAYDAVTKEVIKFTANNGSKRMQELCDEYGIDYNNRNKNTTDKVIIGFHA